MKIALLALSVFFLALPALAQNATPVSATSSVSFSPSADHSATDSFGRPMVDFYDLRVVVEGSTTLVFTKNLGKPTPTAGVISIVVPEFGKLTVGTRHTAQVFAVNESGSSQGSNVSNPFGVAGALPLPRAAMGLTVVP